MQGLQGGEDAMVRLDQLEAMYYELQLQLYEIQFEILKYEELLLTAQLQSLRRQMSGERLHACVLDDARSAVIRVCDRVRACVCREAGGGGLLRHLRES